MTNQSRRRKRYAMCAWIGWQLACFGLFLHPMSPKDFLLLVVVRPMQTFDESYGFEMALLFWGGFVLTIIGLLGWIGFWSIFKSRVRTQVFQSSKFWLAK